MEWSRYSVVVVGLLSMAVSASAQQGSSQILLPGEVPLIDPLEGNHSCDAAVELVAGVYEELVVTAWAPDYFRVSVPPETTMDFEVNLRHGSHDFTVEVISECEGESLFSTSNLYGLVPFEIQNETTESRSYILHLYRDVGFIGISSPASFDIRIMENGQEPYPSLCVGDGTQGDCPCWNFSATGGGCENSSGEGALLVIGGSQITELGGLSVAAHRIPAGAPSILISSLLDGDTQLMPFADGLLCATGPGLIRHEAQIATADGVCDWSASYDPTYLRGPGVRVALQVWYRDSQGWCGSGSNFSQAVALRVRPQ